VVLEVGPDAFLEVRASAIHKCRELEFLIPTALDSCNLKAMTVVMGGSPNSQVIEQTWMLLEI